MVYWGNGAKGRCRWCTIAAAFGPWGAAIGGTAGGLLGLFWGVMMAVALLPPPVNLLFRTSSKTRSRLGFHAGRTVSICRV